MYCDADIYAHNAFTLASRIPILSDDSLCHQEIPEHFPDLAYYLGTGFDGLHKDGS